MNEDREKLASWMMLNGLATGHGDTIDDLLSELTAQVAELKAVHLAARDLTITALRSLIVALSDALTDEGGDWSTEGLDNLRRRVANAIPPNECPDWLHEYRDPPIVQS